MKTARYQNGSIARVASKTGDDKWYFRYYATGEDGKRRYRNEVIGTVKQFPKRRDAELAVMPIRERINVGNVDPRTVGELAAHYREKELKNKAYSTMAVTDVYLNSYILPTWGKVRLNDVKTVVMEEWLASLPMAPGTRAKIRNTLSALFTHALRWEFCTKNPMSLVRTSAKRLRTPDTVDGAEFRSILRELTGAAYVAVFLAGALGLSRSELSGLMWTDVDFFSNTISLQRGVVNGRVGELKTDARRASLPLHEEVVRVLRRWRSETPLSRDDDFIFASRQGSRRKAAKDRKEGDVPMSLGVMLSKTVQPAVKRAGLSHKKIGWHTFRHSLATLLRSLGVDIKVAQELMRHANIRVTLDIYTQAVSSQKREAAGLAFEHLSGGKNESGAEAATSAPLSTIYSD